MSKKAVINTNDADISYLEKKYSSYTNKSDDKKKVKNAKGTALRFFSLLNKRGVSKRISARPLIINLLTGSHKYLTRNNFLVCHQPCFRKFDKLILSIGIDHFNVSIVNETHQLNALAISFYAP